MDTSARVRPVADLRDHLTEERTFLAWIRTDLTLMGFGFGVARLGLFLALVAIAIALYLALSADRPMRSPSTDLSKSTALQPAGARALI
jgi:uncharacterized membrane protein YidH (DUF202 family)